MVVPKKESGHKHCHWDLCCCQEISGPNVTALHDNVVDILLEHSDKATGRHSDKTVRTDIRLLWM